MTPIEQAMARLEVVASMREKDFYELDSNDAADIRTVLAELRRLQEKEWSDSVTEMYRAAATAKD